MTKSEFLSTLDAWIDWNRDGFWGGPFEQIAYSLAVAVGDNILAFDVPSWADAGDTYARFRLNTAGDLATTGAAGNGEMEGYELVIAESASAATGFTVHEITTDADYALSVFAADVDGDGDMDVLSASYGDDMIAWYENDVAVSPCFTTHEIDTDANCAVSVFAADMDGDGDLDVLGQTRQRRPDLQARKRRQSQRLSPRV